MKKRELERQLESAYSTIGFLLGLMMVLAIAIVAGVVLHG